MENLNYNHLYYFWIIAKEGGITSACKRLNLSQPTLSAQLKQLELNFGKPLFDRKARKLLLNDTGKIVYDYADTIFKKGREMVEALQDSTTQNIITLNVGALSTLPKKNLHSYLRTALNDSNVNISLVTGNLDDLLLQLNNHQIDMILSNRPAPTDVKHHVSVLIEKVPVIFIASPDYKHLRRKFPTSLHHQNLLLPPHDLEIRSQIDLYFKKHAIEPRVKAEIEDTELLRVMAISGDGIVSIARSAVSDLIKSKEIYIIGDNLDIDQSYYLITAERKDQHPTVKKILKRFKDS